MISGCRQLFQGDVDAGSTAFEPLHTYVFGWLPSRDNPLVTILLPVPGRSPTESPKPKPRRYLTAHIVPRYDDGGGDSSSNDSSDEDDGGDENNEHNEHTNNELLGLCAAFLPYYGDEDDEDGLEFLVVIDRIAAGQERRRKRAERDRPQQKNTALHFSAVDFAVSRAVDALSNNVHSDAATTKYLRRLASLKSHVKGLRLSTRIRLQGVLYSFTQPGGPRYASKAVNRLAFRTLDELFPHGKRTRRAINFGFRGLFVFSKLTGGLYYACVFSFYRQSPHD